ncbi:MAG: homocysteine S-methyltransferase family protein, partial [Nitrosotalea sp.]
MIAKIPLVELMKQKIVLFDGAMGTEIQKLNPNSEDFPDGKDGFNDGLSFTRPEWIKNIHRNYLKAGADCIETNTFGSNKLKLEEYGYGDKTLEFNKKIAELAVDITKEFSDKPRYVAGSMGPTGFLPSSNDPSLGQIPLEKIREAFEIQAEGLILG